MKQMNRKNESTSDAKFDIDVWPEEAYYMTAHRCSTWSAGMDAFDTVTFHDSFDELKNFVERCNAWARFEENSWRFEIYFRGATVRYVLNRDVFLAGAAAVSSAPQPRVVSSMSRPPRTPATHSMLANATRVNVGAALFDTLETVAGHGASSANARPRHRTLSGAQTELERLPVRIYVHPSAWDALPKSREGRVNGGLGLGGVPHLIFSSQVFRDLVRGFANSDKQVCFIRTREYATHVIATVNAGFDPDDYPIRVCMYETPEDDRNIYMFEATHDYTKGGLYMPPTELAVKILQRIYHVHDV